MSKRAKKCIERQGRKLVVKFDEESRRDYLLGFRRRKDERRKKAKADKEKRDKEQQRQMRAERRKELKKRLAASVGILPDVDSSDDETGKAESKKVVRYEHQDHVVTVTTEMDLDLQSHNKLQLAASRARMPDQRTENKARNKRKKLDHT